MNRGILKCALSFVITIVLVLGMIPMGDANVVEAAEKKVLEIKASELDSSGYYDLDPDGLKKLVFDNRMNFYNKYYKVNLIMDADIEIDLIRCGVELVISGTKTLTLSKGIDCYGSLYLNKNANIKISGKQGYIISDKSIYSEANITIEAGEQRGSVIMADNEVNISGGFIKCKYCNCFFRCYKDANLLISNSEIQIDSCIYFAILSNGNVSIDNSDISCNDLTYGITAKNISVNGGNSYFSINDKEEASENVFFCESFNFNGGTLSLSSTKSPIKTPENGIKLGERCYVSTPEGGTIQSNGAFDFVADVNGNEANTVVLSELSESNVGDIGGNNSGNNDSSGNSGGNNSGNDGSAGNSGGNNSGNDGSAGNAGGNNSGNDGNTGNAGNDGNTDNTQKYCNEWVDGRWYNADGVCDYEGILSWKCNSTGWWVEDTLGWYPQSQWQKIDGKWYYFLDTGYMDYSEYRDGYWLGSDGAWVEDYYGGHWCSDSTGWWYEDSSGWYPTSQWLWIDGKCYYFEADGYLAINKYIDGYWVGSDGAY